MEQIEIKPYDNRDVEEIVEHILAIASGEFGVAVSKESQPDVYALKEFYLQGNGTFLLALCDDKVIGTLGLHDIGNNRLALRKMFVNKHFRGHPHNVAANLLKQALLRAKEKEIRQIFLGTTEHFLSAHRFYEKNSFYRVEKATLPEQFPLMQVDTIFYRLDL